MLVGGSKFRFTKGLYFFFEDIRFVNERKDIADECREREERAYDWKVNPFVNSRYRFQTEKSRERNERKERRN